MAVINPRNRTLIFRLTEDEYATLRVASSGGGARSLSEFARAKLLGALDSRGLHAEISELKSKVAHLAELMEKA
jgi:hypothetical protein